MSCDKNDDLGYYDAQRYFELDAAAIASYIHQEGLQDSAIMDTATGIWYVLYDAGDPDSYEYTISAANRIELPLIHVDYIGQLLNGSVFDENKAELPLSYLIPAWQIAFMPKNVANQINMPALTESGLKKGAKIRIITPSPYGYANESRPGIPAHSPLDFMIEVLDIKSPHTN